MPVVTFQVLEGIDKGRTFRELATPVTIGREEGNTLRLNDERVSRFHAKVQFDNGEIIITDLESTNGTWAGRMGIVDAYLSAGERLRVGSTTIAVDVAAGPKPIALSSSMRSGPRRRLSSTSMISVERKPSRRPSATARSR